MFQVTNIFDTPDDVEVSMGKSVYQMNASELLDYTYRAYHIVYGYKLKGDYIKAKAILSKFYKDYGKENAGKMIKYVFHMMDGELGGEPFSLPGICTAMEWRNNKILADVRRYEGKYQPQSVKIEATSDQGLMSLQSLKG